MAYKLNTNNTSVKNHLESLLSEMLFFTHIDEYGNNVLSLYTYENILYSYQGCEVIFDGLFPNDDDYVYTLIELGELFGYEIDEITDGRNGFYIDEL